MVGRGEVDEDLEEETKEECEKYGKVVKCVIFEVRARRKWREMCLDRAGRSHSCFTFPDRRGAGRRSRPDIPGV